MRCGATENDAISAFLSHAMAGTGGRLYCCSAGAYEVPAKLPVDID